MKLIVDDGGPVHPKHRDVSPYSSQGELPARLARWVRRTASRTNRTTADVIAGCIDHCSDGNHFAEGEDRTRLP